jgi:transcription elongation GreA/GreB family factor
MGRTGRAVCAAALWAIVGLSQAWAGEHAVPDFGTHRVSADARHVARWILDSSDHRGMPFAIVDKQDARIYVFESSGRLSGASPALLGQARGDQSAPGVGERTQAGDVPVSERTTPSGRFVSEPGRNLDGDHVVWVDYATAFAIHRVREGASRLARQERLASDTPRDNRVSLGCVVVPEAFYSDIVQPLLGRTRAVVYVLPEDRPVSEMFEAL